MKEKIKELIQKSGKKGTVNFEGKEKRKSFDENFGKEKIEFVNTLLGSEENKKMVFNKIAGR